MGKKLILTGTKITNTAAPRLARVDLMESAGSLSLMEPAHPHRPWDAGVPAHGALVPNVFADNLTTLGGAGETRSATILGAAIDNGTKGKLERSAKGGLHGIASQTIDLAAGDGLGFRMSPALASYLNANRDHSYYMSVWDRMTRINAGSIGSTYVVSYNTGGSNFNLGLLSASTNAWFDGHSTLVALTNTLMPVNVVGPRRFDATVSSTNTTFSATANFIGLSIGAPTGHASASSVATRNKFWPSLLFYRQYIEDLTVSGRSHAQVSALDAELYTREVLTPGGRYHADTFTDPTTVA